MTRIGRTGEEIHVEDKGGNEPMMDRDKCFFKLLGTSVGWNPMKMRQDLNPIHLVLWIPGYLEH